MITIEIQLKNNKSNQYSCPKNLFIKIDQYRTRGNVRSSENSSNDK